MTDRLPNAERAYVPEEKIVRYLLSEESPRGRTKAAFLRRFGFDRERWRVLEKALLEHARDAEVVEEEATPFGTQYALEGSLRTPDERDPPMRTVWLLRWGERRARFITAYPARRGGKAS